MKKRNYFLVIASGVLALSVAAVYAFFADGDRAVNHMKAGKNEIVIKESFEQPKPGKRTKKEPQIENTGTVDCYVRCKILLSDSRAEPYLHFYTGKKSGFGESWEMKEDGWLYYQGILQVAKISQPLFTHIELAEEMPDEWKSFEIDVVSESVQAEGFADAVSAFRAVEGNWEGEDEI